MDSRFQLVSAYYLCSDTTAVHKCVSAINNCTEQALENNTECCIRQNRSQTKFLLVENFNNNQAGVPLIVFMKTASTHKIFASKTDTIRVGTSQNIGRVPRLGYYTEPGNKCTGWRLLLYLKVIYFYCRKLIFDYDYRHNCSIQ